jgi:hypothetical protein
MTRSNPNGANQWRGDPRQELFISYYFNPKSPTFSNALQSGLKAGYTQEYSESITAQGTAWFAEALSDQKRLATAERVLDEMMEMPVKRIKSTRQSSEDDEDEESIDVVITDPALVKIKQDTAKFVAERMGKHKYSTRNELTGAGGGALIPTEASRDAAKKALEAFLGEPIENENDSTNTSDE